MTGPRRVIRERRVARMSPLFVARGAAVNLRGLVLVMPVVSVGNVGQLSVDLIISTLGLPRVGYIHSDGLVPVVGNDPYATTSENSSEMCTSCEVYASADRKLAVLQIRSPIVQGKQRSFRQQILSWIKENEFSRVVVLSSSFAHHRVDQQLVGCAEGIPLAVLLIFCSEGDNIPDALKLLNFLNEWIQLIAKPNDQQPMSQPQWKIPSSWRLLFGSGIPPALF
ncbi:proteasome assembly chaperone 2 isoform X2 [Amblyraja radiata]|uniref:proteasome assembly chaperone 2 isoform X2 n=1 Tax=Amblyraja radiata TaxID=386614 RepID=UPI001401E081|nr:proteasome assembly chaperone 2 isoform X2 [Amblyraja radiata]